MLCHLKRWESLFVTDVFNLYYININFLPIDQIIDPVPVLILDLGSDETAMIRHHRYTGRMRPTLPALPAPSTLGVTLAATTVLLPTS